MVLDWLGFPYEECMHEGMHQREQKQENIEHAQLNANYLFSQSNT